MSIAEKTPPPKTKVWQPEQQATNAGATMQRWILIVLVAGIFLLLGGYFSVMGARSVINAHQEQMEAVRAAKAEKESTDWWRNHPPTFGLRPLPPPK